MGNSRDSQASRSSRMTREGCRATAVYYTEVARVQPVQDPAEERAFLRRWQEQGDVAARDAVVMTHLRFVVALANKRSKDPEAVREFVAAGNLGLLKAADKFDTRRVPYIRFLTYAGWWIFEEMSSQDYGSASTVYVPADQQKKQRRLAREYGATLQRTGPASVEGMDPGHPIGLTVPIADAKNAPGDPKDEPEALCSIARLRAAIRQGIGRLPPREQTVLNLYYGTKDEPRKLKQIARMLGISTERVRQIKINGIAALHAELGRDEGLILASGRLAPGREDRLGA